jgi:hypothetical protein
MKTPATGATGATAFQAASRLPSSPASIAVRTASRSIRAHSHYFIGIFILDAWQRIFGICRSALYPERTKGALRRAGSVAREPCAVTVGSPLRLNQGRLSSSLLLPRGSGGLTVGLPSGIRLKSRKSRAGSKESEAKWARFGG